MGAEWQFWRSPRRVVPDAATDQASPEHQRDADAAPAAAGDRATDGGDATVAALRRALPLRRRQRHTACQILAAEEEAKRLLVPEPDHIDWLQGRVRAEGWQSSSELLALFGRMLGPMVYVSAAFFAVVGILAWAIPNLLCDEVAKENSVSEWGGGRGV